MSHNEFSYLGNLGQYNDIELALKLKRWKRKQWISKHSLYVEYSNYNSKYLLQYALNGVFINIVSQEFKITLLDRIKLLFLNT